MGKLHLSKWVKQFSISRKLYFVVGIMAVFMAIELFALWFSLDTLSSIRDYVGGEALWSKSQKNAVYYLHEYADKGNESDYVAFHVFMKQPLGDRKARIELEKANPDYEAARAGFLEGGNHPDDVTGMINAFRRFRHIYYIDKAIAIWIDAELYLLKQISICNQIHEQYESGNPSQVKIDELLVEAKKINLILTRLEEDFSNILGEGSRWLESLTLYVLLFTAFTAEIACLILIISVINGITKGVNEVIRVSKQASLGDFSHRVMVDSHDEIGQLAASFSEMITKTGNHLTELRSAEKQIREREQQVNIIFNCSPDGVIVIDIEGVITNWNPKAAEIFGWTHAEAIGKVLSEIIQFPEMMDENAHTVGGLFSSDENLKETLTIETFSFKKDGTLLEVILSMAPTVLLDKYYRVCFIKDITDAKVARRALETETKYVKLLQIIAEASNESASFSEAGQIAIEKICDVIKWPIGHMFVKNKSNEFISSNTWYLQDSSKFSSFVERTGHIQSINVDSLLGRVITLKKAEWITDLSLSSIAAENMISNDNWHRWDEAVKVGLKSAFAFPIMIKDEVVALLEFLSTEVLPPDTQLLEIVDNIGKQLGRVEERQRAGDEIKASEEKLRALTETAIDPIISSDSQGNIIYFNCGAENVFGYSSEEIIGKNLAIIIPEQIHRDVPGMKSFLLNNEAQVLGRTTEFMGRKKNSTFFPVELTLSSWQAKGETFFTYVMRDITERKNKDAELMKLSAVASYTNNAVVITDKNGQIEWVNDGFTRLSGYTLAEIQEKYENTDVKFIDDKTLELIRDNIPVNYEIRSLSKQNEEYWVLATLTPILDEKGQLQKIIVIDSDITKQKATEEALIKAKKLAENSEKAKELFLANMSHEIRTPMNAIIGFTRLLKDAALSPEQKDWLKTIESSGENLLVIINDILDFTKIEAGKIEFEKSEINVATILQATCAMLEPKCKDKGIDLELSIDKAISPSLLGDSVRLTQVLLNLLSNAVKFTHHGKVSCNVSLEEETEQEAQLKFEVCDTGIGIPQDKLGLIFESFAQVSSNTTRKYGGTGLGLTITKNIIEQQGGKISVSSVPNEGSKFVFTLKFLKTEPSIQPKEEINSPNHQFQSVTNLKLLLVEDNIVNQKLAQAFLKKWDITADVADNGVIALKLLDKKVYDIILMDLQMPEMDGYETTQHIRENKLIQHIPIIAMTAHALKEEIDKCLKTGMDDYISKPFSPTELLSKIIKYTQNKQINFKPVAPRKAEFNLDYIKELAGNSNEFLFDIISLFLKDTPPQLDNLSNALNEHDWTKLKQAAHKLKSSMGMFGLLDCARQLTTIEEYAGKLTNLEEMPELVSSVIHMAGNAMEILKEEVHNFAPSGN